MVERLPPGANFRRAQILWEVGLHIASNPLTPHGGNRDMCIVVGSASGEQFKPWLRLATGGSAALVHDVVNGGIEMAFINPSAMLTQAYRGVGFFAERQPVRIIGSYPTWDRFVIAIRRSLGYSSLAEVKEARYPLNISIREDATHSTIVLISQLLAFYGMCLEDIESWGGTIQRVGGPGAKRRIEALRDETIDAVFDEGIRTWLGLALDHGMVPLELEPEAFAFLGALGWRRVLLPAKHYAQLNQDHACIDFGGCPLYASSALPEQFVYDVCDALAARETEMAWEEGTYTGLAQVFHETNATPMDVPLHPGAERWYRERIENS